MILDKNRTIKIYIGNRNDTDKKVFDILSRQSNVSRYIKKAVLFYDKKENGPTALDLLETLLQGQNSLLNRLETSHGSNTESGIYSENKSEETETKEKEKERKIEKEREKKNETNTNKNESIRHGEQIKETVTNINQETKLSHQIKEKEKEIKNPDISKTNPGSIQNTNISNTSSDLPNYFPIKEEAEKSVEKDQNEQEEVESDSDFFDSFESLMG